MRQYQQVCIAVFAVFTMTAASFGIAGAAGWSPRPGCGYTIEAGDTLTRIGRTVGLTPATIRDVNPHVHHVDRIRAGDVIDVCAPDESQPQLLEVSDLSRSWASALRATMPAASNIGSADLLLLTALAGPESAWCTQTVNPSDADPPVWGPSVGCLQTRTLLQSDDIAAEPWRDRAWLEQSVMHQAESAWIIYRQQGATAWGPARPDGKGRVKLPPSGRDACDSAGDPALCRDWWDIAAAAIASTSGGS